MPRPLQSGRARARAQSPEPVPGFRFVGGGGGLGLSWLPLALGTPDEPDKNPQALKAPKALKPQP